jgi:hypothetical protein
MVNGMKHPESCNGVVQAMSPVTHEIPKDNHNQALLPKRYLCNWTVACQDAIDVERSS